MAHHSPPPPPNTHTLHRSGQHSVTYHIPISPPLPSNPILKTTISLPRRSRWTSGLHFHTSHTEFLHLVSGSIFVELDGEVKILSAKAGGHVSTRTRELVKEGLVVEVPKYARHNWGRAGDYLTRRSGGGYVPGVKVDMPEDVDDEVVVEEWTDPSDIAKPLFFWNLNGVITAPEDTPLTLPQRLLKTVLGNWWIPFQLFVIFWDLDNWPVFLSLRHIMASYLGGGVVARKLERGAEYMMTFVVLFTVKVLGCLIGVRAVEQRRTPGAFWEVYKRQGVQ